MDNIIARYSGREPQPTRQQSREAARRRWAIEQERDTADDLVDAGADVITHAMQRMVEVDEQRRVLAHGDEALNMMLARYQLKYLRITDRITDGLFRA